MMKLNKGALLAALLAAAQPTAGFAQTQNAMDYQLLTPQEAAGLASAGGSLGLNLVAGQQINDHGLSFELLHITAVRAGTPGAQAGLRAGDQIIAADNRVFPTLQTFADYVRSLAPGKLMTLDYLPANGGPQQAQRVGVTVGSGGRAVTAAGADASHQGLSTGTKLAIGAGAVALFGCYELGCFKRKQPAQ